MEPKNSRQNSARLLALDIRLEELSGELRRTQLQLYQLEAALEDRRLSGLFGDVPGAGADLEPELERCRGRLESQQAQVERVMVNRRQARVDYMLSRVRERREEQAGTREVGGEA